MNTNRITRGAALVSMLVALTGCNVFTPLGAPCSSSEDCTGDESQEFASDMVCDPGGFCRLREDAINCTAQTEERDCGVFAYCTSTGFCEERDPIVAIINNPIQGDNVERARIQTTTMRYLESRIADVFGKFEGRRLRFVEISSGNSLTEREEAFASATRLGASAVALHSDQDIIDAQRFFRGTNMLVLGQFANDSRFDREEFDETRASYALAPEPILDFVTWSRHLAENDLCQKVASVYVSGTSSEFVLDFIGDYIESYDLEYVGAFGMQQGSPRPVIAKLQETKPDCVFALALKDEEPTNSLADVIASWSDTNPHTIRWLFTRTDRFDEVRANLEGAELAQLAGAIGVTYSLGGTPANALIQDLSTSFLPSYTPACLEEGCPEKPNQDNYEQDDQHIVGFSFDQGMLLALSFYRALHKSSGGPVSRLQVLEGFRSINGGSEASVRCEYSTIRSCFEAIDVGGDAAYRGASGPLNFVSGGRTESIDETMRFIQASPDEFSMTNQASVDYEREDMLESLREAPNRFD